MPERKSPRNFRELIQVLDAGLSDGPEVIASLSERDIDEMLAEKGIDPTEAVGRVQQFIDRRRAQLNSPPSEVKVHAQKARARPFWTHPSVVGLHEQDPIEYISARANKVVLEAFEKGWTGPPYDPLKLATCLGVRVVPNAEVSDARAVPLGGKCVEIQFNPTKARSRIRYSIAHELGHILFPDCHDEVRNRLSRSEQRGDDWQLEMLCNIAAAEFLMPLGSFREELSRDASIHEMLDFRKKFEVSMEAVLLRFARLTEVPCAVFAASQRQQDRYSVEYGVSSRAWPILIKSGSALPKSTCVRECTAIGYTAEGDEEWSATIGSLHLQCVAIPPFPGEIYPRVVGIIRPRSPVVSPCARITFVKGDATEPRGEGYRVIAHVVNDKTPNWGAGFALAVRRKWPEVQEAFRSWALSTPNALKLGNVFHSEIAKGQVAVYQMICQRGYGPSPTPRIRYGVLKDCLEHLAQFAIKRQASIHMPLVGAGQAGGSWALIQQLIDELICSRGLHVTIYELPDQPRATGPQKSLFD